MKYRIAIQIIAIYALSMWANAVFPHESHDTKPTQAVIKEQKPWGIAGDAKAVRRTVVLAMSDAMRFTPDRFEVRLGETVRITIKNTGAVMHELVIGTQKELADHAAMMVKFPGMEHSEPYMAHVSPGKTGEIIWTFNRSGEFDFACLVAGHYQAGMMGKIKVVGTAEKSALTDAAEGEVRKIDKDAKKITLKHGPIKNMDMPGMTMVFQVKDVSLLDKLAVGDKVTFTAEQQQGAYVVTRVDKIATQ